MPWQPLLAAVRLCLLSSATRCVLHRHVTITIVVMEGRAWSTHSREGVTSAPVLQGTWGPTASRTSMNVVLVRGVCVCVCVHVCVHGVCVFSNLTYIRTIFKKRLR